MQTIHIKKKATNVTIDVNLLKKAKEYKINLSQTLENSLKKIIKEIEAQNWKRENKEAIDAFNKRVSKNGLFGDNFRQF